MGPLKATKATGGPLVATGGPMCHALEEGLRCQALVLDGLLARNA
jgi:hypothetical protein